MDSSQEWNSLMWGISSPRTISVATTWFAGQHLGVNITLNISVRDRKLCWLKPNHVRIMNKHLEDFLFQWWLSLGFSLDPQHAIKYSVDHLEFGTAFPPKIMTMTSMFEKALLSLILIWEKPLARQKPNLGRHFLGNYSLDFDIPQQTKNNDLSLFVYCGIGFGHWVACSTFFWLAERVLYGNVPLQSWLSEMNIHAVFYFRDDSSTQGMRRLRICSTLARSCPTIGQHGANGTNTNHWTTFENISERR